MEVILASAAEVFSQHGYYGSSMEDVARACDCAPATLYGYFKGKQELHELAQAAKYGKCIDPQQTRDTFD